MSLHDVTPISVKDYRRLARKRLPRFLFDYIDGAANDEVTMAANLSDFRRSNLKQHVMRDVGDVDTRTVLAGHSSSMPVALAPVGMAGIMARRGEVQGARASKAVGIPFTGSTVSICPVEEIRDAVQQPFWFQLYMLRDRDVVLALLERAQQAGCETLVFTVDLAVQGMRRRDFRNGMLGTGFKAALARAWQIATRPAWALDVGLMGRPHLFGNLREVVPDAKDFQEYKRFVDEQYDPGVTWDDIAWLRNAWNGRILIKGVLEADDARAAADVGADGVVVSNHGGRQLDGVASTISKLPAVAAAVGDRIEVYLDGGVRSGVDVLKAVALGAHGVMIGRPWVWAMAGGGEQGLIDLLNQFRTEIATGMALMGVNRLTEITPFSVE